MDNGSIRHAAAEVESELQSGNMQAAVLNEQEARAGNEKAVIANTELGFDEAEIENSIQNWKVVSDDGQASAKAFLSPDGTLDFAGESAEGISRIVMDSNDYLSSPANDETGVQRLKAVNLNLTGEQRSISPLDESSLEAVYRIAKQTGLPYVDFNGRGSISISSTPSVRSADVSLLAEKQFLSIAKKAVDRDGLYDVWNERFQTQRKSVDYSKAPSWKEIPDPNNPNGKLSYIVETENTKPLFDEARAAKKFIDDLKPDYLDLIHAIRDEFGDGADLVLADDNPSIGKMVESLATKLWKKNRELENRGYSAVKAKDLLRNTLRISRKDFGREAIARIKKISEGRGYRFESEIKSDLDSEKNPYLGIELVFTKNGVQTELQVSNPEL